MKTTQIIKEAFIFPSKNLSKLALYIILAAIISFLLTIGLTLLLNGGIASTVYGLGNYLTMALGIIIFVIAFLACFVLSGFQISIIKSGIDNVEQLPEFNWRENFVTGVYYTLIKIVYYIIPAIIVYLVAWLTGFFSQTQEALTTVAYAVATAPANTTVVATDVVPQSLLAGITNSFAITAIIAAILFIIFGLLKTMAEARLANTNDLGTALSFSGAFNDIKKVGFGKFLAVIILVVIIILIVAAILGLITTWIHGFIILSIIITPYVTFFAARAVGLMYSDIA